MNSNNQINIFIVEDNKVFALALKADIESNFEKMPIKIHSFITGETCMQKFNQIKPQVVILDYHLNSKFTDAIDGIKVLDLIKAESKDTNVIMLTSEDHIDIALKSFQHGAFDYVVKTETKFRKINYSLLNIFKMMSAQKASNRYKNLLVATFLCIGLLIGGAIAIQLFAPYLFL